MTKPCNPKNNQNKNNNTNNNANENNHKEDEGRNLNLNSKKNKPACAACKKQRKGCVNTCFLAPYFPHTKTHEFNAVHDLFGLSNVQRILKQHDDHKQRKDVVDALIWEAQMWLEDPVRGSYGAYKKLKQQHDMLLANYALQLQPQPQPQPQQQGAVASGLPMSALMRPQPQRREEIIRRNDAGSWGHMNTSTGTSSISNGQYNGPILSDHRVDLRVVPVQAQSYNYAKCLTNPVLIPDGWRLGYGDQRYRQQTEPQERVFDGGHYRHETDHVDGGGHETETDNVDGGASFRHNSTTDHANHHPPVGASLN